MRRLLQTIIALAHALNLSVTAEGIETIAQAAHLQSLGCSRGQGFLYARPAPAVELNLSGTASTARAA